MERLSLGENSVIPLLLGLVALLVPIVPFPFVPQVYKGFSLRTHVIFPHAEALVLASLTMACLLTTPRLLAAGMRGALSSIGDRLAVALAAWAMVSMAWSDAPQLAAHAQAWIVVAVVLYLVVRVAAISSVVLDSIAWGTAGAVALNVIFALGQLHGDAWFLFGQGEEPIGLVGNRNHLAYYLALAIPILVWLVSRAGRGSEGERAEGGGGSGVVRVALVALIAVSLAVVVSTQCRGGVVAACAGLLAAVVWIPSRPAVAAPPKDRARASLGWRPGSWAGGRLAMGVALAGAVVAIVICGQALTDPLKVGTASSRAFGWRLTIAGIAQAPIAGHGIASFQIGYPLLQQGYFHGLATDKARLAAGEWRHARFFRQAHNDPLQLLYELGLVGLFLFLGWLCALARGLGTALRDLPPGPRRAAAAAGGAVLVAALAESLVGFPAQIDPTAMLIVVGAALVSGAVTAPVAPAAGTAGAAGGGAMVDPVLAIGEAASSRPRGVMFALAQGVLALGVVAVLGRDWQAQVLDARGRALVDAKPMQAARTLVASLALDGSNGETLCELGRALFALDDLDAAREAFDATRPLYPSASTWINMACVSHALAMRRARAGQGRDALALDALSLRQAQEALALDPTSIQSQYFMALALREAGDLQGAVEFLERGLTLSSQDPRLGWEEARLLMRMGLSARAVDRLAQNLGVLDASARLEDPSGLTMDLTSRDYRVRNDVALAQLLKRMHRSIEAAPFEEDARRLSPDELKLVRN